jgi:hypothetical protein
VFEDSRKNLFDGVFGNTFMREWFQKISGHGITPIFISTAVTATGNSNMFIRSVAVMLCAVWLSIDVGIWLSSKKWKAPWKSILFAIAFCLSSSVGMGIMRWFLVSTLEDQQADTFKNLSIEVPKPEVENPITTMFSVKNNGNTNIGDHQISCLDNLIVFQNLSIIQGDRSSFAKQSGPLIRGGDPETTPCLAMFQKLGTVLCADVTVVIDYRLDTQPSIPKKKFVRFVTRKEGSRFIWYGQPAYGSTDPCRDVWQKLVTYPLSSLPF